ncbi:hypothetical protein [Halomonas borealis]|jgi:hypothetical protein|uniref:hypothetical protein n=1 Tax=Halomonas borealis TaxID=2508710 RepID=UPI0010A05A52|nr:hypothetical protein [Halomonas borealis]
MSKELADFEKSMHEEIDAFLKSESRPTKPPQATPRSAPQKPSPSTPASEIKTGHIVKLAVRTKQLEQDTAFEHHSASISRLEAQMEAEKAARQAGYPIIGHVIEIQRV